MRYRELVTTLPWPEVVGKVNGAMKAMGWKGQRRDDGAFMFSTKGQIDDEWYMVIIDNRGNDMFTYALGTVEEGDPYIGEQDSLPNTEASVSELMNAVREGFGLNEAFDNPYKGKWEKSDYGDIDVNAKLPDGTYLNIMFNQEYDGEGEEVIHVEFHRNNSQEVTGEGDAQRIFATVLDAIQKYIKKYKPQQLSFSASKSVDMDADDVERFNPESRAKLYTRLVQRYAGAWGYQSQHSDEGDVVIYQLTRAQGIAENFHDGKNPQDKGDSKRHGVPTKASISTLRKVAKQGGRKGQLAHWMANMKSGRAKAKRK